MSDGQSLDLAEISTAIEAAPLVPDIVEDIGPQIPDIQESKYRSFSDFDEFDDYFDALNAAPEDNSKYDPNAVLRQVDEVVSTGAVQTDNSADLEYFYFWSSSEAGDDIATGYTVAGLDGPVPEDEVIATAQIVNRTVDTFADIFQ